MNDYPPVIIEAAINGITTRQRNPHVPLTPDEIAEDALACIDAGASTIHHHIDLVGVDEEAAADRYLEAWRPVLAARPDALLYPTVHVGPPRSYEHHIPLAASGMARIGIVDPGSVNLGGRGADGLPAGGIVYGNSFETIARAFALCEQLRLGPSMAIYEPGFLRTVMAYRSAGRLPAGGLVKLYFSGDDGYMGAPFGLPPTATGLAAYREILGDSGLPWAASLVGGDLGRSGLAELAVAQGGHLHVGIEFYGGDRRPTNVELVAEAAELCARQGRPVATPDEAAAILGLPRPRPGS